MIHQTNQVAQPSVLGGSDGRAFVIPFLPYDILPFGYVASFNTQEGSERKESWVTRDGSNLTRNRAIAT